MIASVAVKQKINKDIFFDYIAPEPKPELLSLVSVPFRSNRKNGIIISYKSNSKHAKDEIIEQVSAGQVITKYQLKLAKEISTYFISPIGPTIFSFIPNFSKKSFSKISKSSKIKSFKKTDPIVLTGNYDQRLNYFIQLIDTNNQNLIIAPKIEQVEQVRRFVSSILPNIKIHIWHSQISTRDRLKTWQDCINGKKVIIIGTRDSIFLPFTSLSRIYLEDPSNFAYFDEQLPYYNAYYATRKLASLFNAKLIIGENIPDLLTFTAIIQNKVEFKHYTQNVEYHKFNSWNHTVDKEPKEIVKFCNKSHRMLLIGPWKDEKKVCIDCNSEISNINTMSCPKCSSTKIKNVFFSKDEIRAQLDKILPDKEIVFATIEDLDRLPPIFDTALIPYFDAMAKFPFLNYQEKMFSRIHYLPSLSINKVGIFTYNKKQQFLKYITESNWKDFLKIKLREREKHKLPPFTRAVKIISKDKMQVEKILKKDIFSGKINIGKIDSKYEALVFVNHESFKEVAKYLKMHISAKTHFITDPVDFGV